MPDKQQGVHATVAVNRQAYHDYFVDESLEAGIVLTGTEIKSVRSGKVNLRGAFARVKDGEMWIEGMHIAPYEQGTYMNHEPLRNRKLLLHKKQINALVGKVQMKGQTLIPLKLYFKNDRAKIELGLCRGKKLYDKRESIAKRDAERDIARAVRNR
jgi:SsrA-binding protein